MLEVNTFTVDIYPQNDSNYDFGIGILDKCEENDSNVLPSSSEIKNAVCDLLV